ncbi:MAG: hypothetical protein NZ529_09465 [Cytophagaceae bacterium]|nr:hypothetical protein [Cytophagaceae bacterium]MDW8457013.1 hypothetical protein [Cytophagaceae bacterium]
MIRTTNILTIICTMLVWADYSLAQKKPQIEYSGFFDSYYYRGPLTFSLGIGPASYRGDAAKGFIKFPAGVGFNVGAHYRVWPRTVLGVEFTYAGLSSSRQIDSVTTVRYSSSALSLELFGRLFLVDDIVRKAADRRKFRPLKFYILAGAGVLMQPAFIPQFPAGLGLQYSISPRLSGSVEYAHKFTLSDRLDGIRYSPPQKDSYGMFSVRVQYSPFAPKRKKKTIGDPASPNPNRQEHQEWRKKKKPEQQPPQNEEQPIQENNNETPPEEEQNQENAPNDGWGN